MGLGLVAFLFLVNASISGYNTRRLAGNHTQVVNAQAVLTTLEEVLADITEAESSERGFLITGDESYLSGYRTAAGELDAALKELEGRIGDDRPWQVTLGSLRRDVNARMAELDVAIAARKEGGIVVTVLEVRGSAVKLGCQSPTAVPIFRHEVLRVESIARTNENNILVNRRFSWNAHDLAKPPRVSRDRLTWT